jgi:hypothetical protein
MPELPKKLPIGKKSFSLDDFKKKTGSVDVPDKKTEFIPLSSAFKKGTGLPGIPKGYTTLFRGFSNTGKSTALCETLVSAQKMGILPIIIDTENNLGRERLKAMGFDWDSGFYIEIDNEFLLEKFGKAKEPKKMEASIEDLADAIHFYLDKQESGELPYDLLFAIDSLGTLDCDMTVRAKLNETGQNNMWNAGAFERAFKSILNYRIPNSRKTTKQYTNTLIGVQKIWLEANPVGQPTVRHKGGDAFLFGARLIIHHGGKKSQGIKYISAISKGTEISFGIQTNIESVKTQIDGDFGGISIQGDIISTPHGFIGTSAEEIAEYKKNHLSYFRDKLGSDLKESDIETKVDISALEDDEAKAIFNEM